MTLGENPFANCPTGAGEYVPPKSKIQKEIEAAGTEEYREIGETALKKAWQQELLETSDDVLALLPE